MLQHKPLGQQTGLGLASRLGHQTPLGQSQSLGQTSQQLLLDLSQVDWTEMFYPASPNLAQGMPGRNGGFPPESIPRPTPPTLTAPRAVSPSDSPSPARSNSPAPSPSESALEPITSQKPLHGDRAMVPPRTSLVNPLIQDSARAFNTESTSAATVPLFSAPPASATSSANSQQPPPATSPQAPETVPPDPIPQLQESSSPPSTPTLQPQPSSPTSPTSDRPPSQASGEDSPVAPTENQTPLTPSNPSNPSNPSEAIAPNSEIVQAAPETTSDARNRSHSLQPPLATNLGDRAVPEGTPGDSIQLEAAPHPERPEPPSFTSPESNRDRPTASELSSKPPSNKAQSLTPPSVQLQPDPPQPESGLIQETQLTSADPSESSDPSASPTIERQALSTDPEADSSPSSSPRTIAPDIISPDIQESSTIETDQSTLLDVPIPSSNPESLQTQTDSSANLPSPESPESDSEANILQAHPSEPTSHPEPSGSETNILQARPSEPTSHPIAIETDTPSEPTDTPPNLQTQEESSHEHQVQSPSPPVVQTRQVTPVSTESPEPTAKTSTTDPSQDSLQLAPSSDVRSKASQTNSDLPSISPSTSTEISKSDSGSDSGSDSESDANPPIQAQERESETINTKQQEPVDKQLDPISQDLPISPKRQTSDIQLSDEPNPRESTLSPSHPQESDQTSLTPFIQPKTRDTKPDEPDPSSTISPKASPSTQTDRLASFSHEPPLQPQHQDLKPNASGLPSLGLPSIQPLVQPSKFNLSSYLEDERTTIPDESDITASSELPELAPPNHPPISSWANLEDLINLNDNRNNPVEQSVDRDENLTLPWQSLVESLERIAQSDPQPENRSVSEDDTEAPKQDISSSPHPDPTKAPEEDSEHIKTAEDIEIEESQISILAERVYISLRRRLILEREKSGITPSEASDWIDIKTRSKLAYHKGRLRQKDKALFESLTYDIQSSRIFHNLTQDVYHKLKNRLETLSERLAR